MLYRRDIDGLRALAVLPVLMFHFGAGWMPGGFIGVDIFFVISGFVIAGSIEADIQVGVFSIERFYFKRIKRILPALAATLIATSIGAAIILLPSDLADFGFSLAATSSFLSNLYFWQTSSGYFSAAAQTMPLLHTWSLAVEEQYYLLAPVALAIVSRWGGRRWLLFLGPILIVSLACSVAAVFVGPAAGFYLLPSRLWELLLGALLALSGRPVLHRPLVRETLAMLGLGLILFGLFGLREGEAFPGWNAAYPCVGAGLLIQSGRAGETPDRPPLINRLLASAPFVGIGRISYSLYLVHWPIVAFHKYVTLRSATAIEAAGMLVASISLAWLSWRYIEQPVRRVGFDRLRLVLLCQFITLGVGVGAGASLVAAHGLPGRFPGYVERQIAGVEDWGGPRCFNQNPTHAVMWSSQTCTRIRGEKGRILLWGDSFAAEYMPGILRDRSRINADVMQYTFAGCPPVLAYASYARVACAPFNRHAIDIIRQQRIDTVVLAAKWIDTPQHTIDQLGATVNQLRDMGVRVFVIGQSPIFLMDLQHIDYLSGQSNQIGAVEWPIAFDPEINRKLRAQSNGATFIDPLITLCRGARCEYRRGDEFYYADYGHFSTFGSVRATRAYFPSGVRSAPDAERAVTQVNP